MKGIIFVVLLLVAFVVGGGHGGDQGHGNQGGGHGGGDNNGHGGGNNGGHGGDHGHQPPRCNVSVAARSWLHCVNHTAPCPCYATACPQNIGTDIPDVSLTIEKAIVLEYNRILVERTYQDAWSIFAPDILVTVPYFDISFGGAGANVAYLYLGDPDISDEYVILSSDVVLMLQQGLQVFAQIAITYQNLHTEIIWSTTNFWVFRFAENHTIVEENIYIDSLGTIDNLLATGTLNLDTTILCEDIQTDCTGANLQYGGSVSTCVDFMNTLTVEVFGQVANGNTVFCRSWHEVLARSDPGLHCEHTGPLKINPTVTPCNDF